jgi:D-alanyl-D-alanine carboxypeptidase/D-alanyl-D-alanine-endopeptidase (penicillin-binding protein 4)
MTRVRTFFALLVALAAAASSRGDELANKINNILDAPEYRASQWGILVVDGKSGKVLFDHNAERLFSPASVAKLFSCAAGLCLLGADRTFTTPVYRRGKVEEGRLQGELILVPQGDLTLGGRTLPRNRMAFKDDDHIYANGTTLHELPETDPLAGLVDLAKQVKAAGIDRVKDVLIDDRFFAHARGTGSGPDLLTPIVINDNVLDIIITPGDSAGDAAKVRIHPATSYYEVDAKVETIARPGNARIDVESFWKHRITVRGKVVAESKPIIRIHPVEEPAAFARALFIEVLRKEGVQVDARADRLPETMLPLRNTMTRLDKVAELTSPPLSELIKVTLKVSHNLYASTLPILFAPRFPERTLAAGMRRQGTFLDELGVDVKSISFGGGAGGSPADLATPKATVQLLQAMRKRPEFEVYRDCLPVLGVDGTLATLVAPDSPARGKVFAKTGTLSYLDLMSERFCLRSKALAGYATTANGQEVSFAIFINNAELPRGETTRREGLALARLAEIIYLHTP